MNYVEFFRFLKKWRDAKRYPPKSAWPDRITLDTKAWEGIGKIYNLTRMDQHEYETSFFFVEGQTFLTTPLRGTRENVTAQHSLQVKYQVDQRRRVYVRHILLDGSVISRDAVKPEKMPRENKIGFLFNIHSHPEHVNKAGETTYSFFSDTDIRTLLVSDALIAGLVTDRFWLVGKTEDAISSIGDVGENLLYNISSQAFAGEKYLDKIIQTNMERWGLVFYSGKFRNRLERVN